MLLIVSMAVASTASVAVGQTTEGALDGTLLKARTSGEVAVGYRDASIPLSYLSASKEPVGYSIDLCRAIVDAMSTEVSRDLVARFNLKTTILTGADHADSYAQLVQGKADAFATDDVLLYGFIALNRAQDQLMVVGDFLSYEPYGIMFRKDDPQLAKLVATTLHDLAASRELEQTYNKWFMRQLPNGQRLNMPMSVQLAEMIRIMGDDATTQ